MSKVKIKLNRAGVRELLRSDEMKGHLTEIAEAVRDRAGDGYTVTSHTGKNRANASVFAESFEAKRDNMKNNTLLRSLQ